MSYPEALESSEEDFNFFKKFTREFLFGLGLKHTKSFKNNPIFGGFDVKKKLFLASKFIYKNIEFNRYFKTY